MFDFLANSSQWHGASGVTRWCRWTAVPQFLSSFLQSSGSFFYFCSVLIVVISVLTLGTQMDANISLHLFALQCYTFCCFRVTCFTLLLVQKMTFLCCFLYYVRIFSSYMRLADRNLFDCLLLSPLISFVSHFDTNRAYWLHSYA